MGATYREIPGKGWYVFVYRNGNRKGSACGHGPKGEAEARATAQAINGEHEALEDWLDGGALPVGKTCRGWLATYRSTLSRSYEATASSLIENHLAPYFGDLDLRMLDEPKLLAFIESRLEDGKSSATATNALSLLRRVCQIHVEARILEHNPCLRSGALVSRVAARYETEVKRAAAWTHDEATALLDLARTREPFIYEPLYCALHTGMRRGEILGLGWEHVGRDRIMVSRALVKGRLKSPKSGKYREIPISSGLNAVFDELRAAHRVARDWRDTGPVFLSPFGELWDESNFSKAWRRLQKLAVAEKIRPLRFHDARHTFATWALEGGRSIKWVQEMLGHSSAELTLKTYAHVMPRDDDGMEFLPGATERSLKIAR